VPCMTGWYFFTWCPYFLSVLCYVLRLWAGDVSADMGSDVRDADVPSPLGVWRGRQDIPPPRAGAVVRPSYTHTGACYSSPPWATQAGHVVFRGHAGHNGHVTDRLLRRPGIGPRARTFWCLSVTEAFLPFGTDCRGARRDAAPRVALASPAAGCLPLLPACVSCPLERDDDAARGYWARHASWLGGVGLRDRRRRVPDRVRL
jgi:hypothetical protein